MLTKGMLLSSAGLLGFLSTLPELQAQQAFTGQHAAARRNAVAPLQPVPRHGTAPTTLSARRISHNVTGQPSTAAAKSSAGLQWRTSSQVSSKQQTSERGTFDPFETNHSFDQPQHGPSGTTLQVVAQAPNLSNVHSQSISQAAWLGSPSRPTQLTTTETNQSDSSPAAEITLSAPIRNRPESLPPQSQINTASDDPFTPPSILELTPATSAQRRIAFPTPKTSIPNQGNDTSVAQLNSGGVSSLSAPITSPRVAQLPSLPAPADKPIAPATQSPPNQKLSLPTPTQQANEAAENPFPINETIEDQGVKDSLRSRLADVKGLESTRDYGAGTDYLSQANFSCEEFRDRIAAQTIDQISLDISPPFRPDEFDQRRHDELFADFIEQQPIRKWSSIDGRLLTEGRLIDLAYEKAVIELENGEQQYIPMSELSEGDLAHLNTTWGLPRECRIEQVAYQPRQWAPSKVTWTASNLCHNPLYFESVNLERYGHTRGPLLEPVVQSAHFFGNILILPYKMGVHGPRECQYALGYYRPGNEAPWIKQPLPISARGALAQAATMSGLFWLIP
ncbi:MAG: hypothetical protein L7U72_13785 [Rubripirellula sp.]|nr:hypothetical protein [Rubripirellula sp.]